MTYSTGTSPESVVLGDFNNDTHLDIALANYGDNTVSVFLGYGNGSFANQIIYPTDSHPVSIAVNDLNSDTRLDIVAVTLGYSTVSVLLGYGNGSFSKYRTYATGNLPESIAIGDFNNDSRSDLVIGNFASNDMSVLLGYGNGSFANQKRYSTGSGPQGVAIGNFNNDTQLDIVVINYSDNNLMILLGGVNENFVKHTMLPTGNGSRPRSVAIGDFNNDTKLDIVVANYGSDNIAILLGYDNGSFAAIMTYSTSRSSSPYSVTVGDLNNDMLLDIIVANYASNTLDVLLGDDNGTFATMILFPMKYGSHPFSIIVGDFSSDGKMDLAVANSGSDNLNIFLQTC
jgi:hypothetical protein